MLRIPVEARRVSDHGVWIEVDMGALAHNVRAMRRRLTSGCELIAVVKANAYGHGAVEVAHAVLRAGASSLAVSSIAEGCELRASGISAPILVCGPLAADEAAACLQAGLQPTLSDREQLRACAAAARQPVACHVEIDTGMARHGVAAGDFVDFLAAMRRHGRLRLESVFTHFSGLGAEDMADPAGRLGKWFKHLANPVGDPEETAVRQISRLGHRAEDVRHVVMTHLDLDHTGALSDFPHATVHVMEA